MNYRKIIQASLIAAALSIIMCLPAAYKYNQYKTSFNKAMTKLKNEKFDDAIAAFNETAKTYYGNKNLDKINNEIEKANRFKDNKRYMEEGQKYFDDENYLYAIDKFKRVSSDDTKRYALAQSKLDECRRLYVSTNIDRAKITAAAYHFEEALEYLDLLFRFDMENKEAITLKDEYLKEKEKAEIIAKNLGFEYDIQVGYIRITKSLDFTTKNIAIPSMIDGKTVGIVGSDAFYNHWDLESVSIPESVICLEGAPFYRCYALKKLTIPKSVKQIIGNPVYRCPSITQICVDPENEYFSDLDGALYNKDKTTLLVYPEGKTDVSFTIPSTVKKIDEGTFGHQSYSKLNTVVIPASVTEFPDDNMFVFPDKITLKVKPGSAAEQYAKTYDIKYTTY